MAGYVNWPSDSLRGMLALPSLWTIAKVVVDADSAAAVPVLNVNNVCGVVAAIVWRKNVNVVRLRHSGQFFNQFADFHGITSKTPPAPARGAGAWDEKGRGTTSFEKYH